MVTRKDLERKEIQSRSERNETVDENEAIALQPTTIVLLQELERWNLLVSKMSISCVELQKALKGIVGMSGELDNLAEALFHGNLPVCVCVCVCCVYVHTV